MAAAPAVSFSVGLRDRGLQPWIERIAAAARRTVKDQTRLALKNIVANAQDYTPPGSQKGTGKTAQAIGEVAVVRDMKKLFVPVTLKHKRPEVNPDPAEIHRQRIAASSHHAGSITRGRRQAYYVDRAKITSLKNTLQSHVGRLASGWARAAEQLGLSVLAFVARHGTSRGTEVRVIESAERVVMRVINHFPDTDSALIVEMKRRIEYYKGYALAGLKRQLPFLLKRSFR